MAALIANILLEPGFPGGFPFERSKTGSLQRGQGGLLGTAEHQSLFSALPISEKTTALPEFLWSTTNHGPAANQPG